MKSYLLVALLPKKMTRLIILLPPKQFPIDCSTTPQASGSSPTGSPKSNSSLTGSLKSNHSLTGSQRSDSSLTGSQKRDSSLTSSQKSDSSPTGIKQLIIKMLLLVIAWSKRKHPVRSTRTTFNYEICTSSAVSWHQSSFRWQLSKTTTSYYTFVLLHCYGVLNLLHHENNKVRSSIVGIKPLL